MFGPEDLQLPPPKEWSKFESLIRDLTAARLGDSNVQKHGRSGQTQHGIDMFGQLPGGGIHGVQCKKKDILAGHKLTIKELREEVQKARGFNPALTEFVLTTTALDDATLQREALRISERHTRKGLFSVRVEGWNTITDLLGQHHGVAQKYYGIPPTTKQMTLAFQPEPKNTARASAGRRTKPPVKSLPVVLPSSIQHAFGLLAAQATPLGREALSSLFPNVGWGSALRTLHRAGLVEKSDGGTVPTREARKGFFRNEADRKPFDDAWREALEPLSGHVDTAMMLMTTYAYQGEWSKLFGLLAETAESVEPGSWNDQVLSLAHAFDKEQFLRSMSRTDQLALLYAGSICLSRTDCYPEARNWIVRLRDEADRAKGSWYRAEADLLLGITYDREGDCERAVRHFRQAAARAKRHRHHLLRGHALNNLATALIETNSAEAEKVLEESLKAKRLAGEKNGGVAALIGFGLLAANAGRHAEAKRHFERAAKLAERADDRYGRAIAECNIAAAAHDLGMSEEAAAHYREAKQISAEEGFSYPLGLAKRGLAVALATLGRHRQAERGFWECVELERQAGHELEAVVGLHDVGVMQLYQRRFGESRKTIRRSGALAAKINDREWIYRAARDEAMSHHNEGKIAAASTLLTRRVTEFKSAKEYQIAARLAEDLALLWVDEPGDEHRVEQAYQEAETCWKRAKSDGKEHWRVLGQLYAWRWDHGQFDKALEALREQAAVAERYELREPLCRSLDQLGVCLQELNRLDEAEPAHKRAMKLARRLAHSGLIENTLNNLGELYRKTDKPDQAIEMYRECEASARLRNDNETAISTAHNRGLLLLDTGQRAAGLKVIRRCRDDARRQKFWREYARALLCLGNAAWDVSDSKAAMSRYRLAVGVAEKHGLTDLLWSARVNLAGELHSAGKLAAAIRELEAVEPLFATEPDGHRLTAFQARCYRKVGEEDKADATWEKARIRALAAGNENAVVSATAELAKSTARRKGFKAGDDALRAVLSRLGNEGRVTVCGAGVEMAVEHEEFERGARWLALLTKAGKKLASLEEVVDGHMLFGDALWKTEEHRPSAAQAYVAGQSYALSLTDGALVQAGLHILWKLLDLAAPDRTKLHDEMKSWLTPQNGRRTPGAARYVLWPFSVADRVGDTKGMSRAAVERRVFRAFDSEFPQK